MPIDLSKIKAIDVHVHAEISCHDPEDPVMGQYFDAASACFKAPRERPKMRGSYREQPIPFCKFTVDCESGIGAKYVSKYEIAEFARMNDDICMAFTSIDREHRTFIANQRIKPGLVSPIFDGLPEDWRHPLLTLTEAARFTGEEAKVSGRLSSLPLPGSQRPFPASPKRCATIPPGSITKRRAATTSLARQPIGLSTCCLASPLSRSRN